MSGRPINEDRQIAISLGFRTYTGTPHPKCGMTERYVSGGGCVHCARLIASEQREARKFLIANAVLETEQQVRDEDGIEEINYDPIQDDADLAELDNVDQALQDERIAEARDEQAAVFQRSIEDLM